MAKKSEIATETLAITSIIDAHKATRETLKAYVFSGRNSVSLVDMLRILCVGFASGEITKCAKVARGHLRKAYTIRATGESRRHEFCTPDNDTLFTTYLDCVQKATRVYTRDEKKLADALV